MSSQCGNGGGGCQSPCGSRPKEVQEDPTNAMEPDNDTLKKLGCSSISSNGAQEFCTKCQESIAIHNKHCLGCFRASLFGKFKLAVTSNAMISPLDNVLIAFSGRPSSRVVLQFIHEMQQKSQKSWEVSNDKSLPVFGVGVAFVDETAVSMIPAEEIEKSLDKIRGIVSSLAPPTKKLYIERIEAIFSKDLMEGKAKLSKLLDTVTDATGKEDFLQYLRSISLQKIALDNGYTKLVLGSCTTGIACHIISSTVKGHGYSLPADVQYVDARMDVPVVLPLRDCLKQELAELCHLDGLKTTKIFNQPPCGINSLVSSFLSRLQEENPSRARTIVKTAGKLSPFRFNKLCEIDSDDLLPSRLRKRIQHMRNVESTPSEILCPICGGPLCDSDLLKMKNHLMKSQSTHNIFFAHCCETCSFQILPDEAALYEEFYSLLPPHMTGRVKDDKPVDPNHLREQIEDLLLSDEDET